MGETIEEIYKEEATKLVARSLDCVDRLKENFEKVNSDNLNEEVRAMAFYHSMQQIERSLSALVMATSLAVVATKDKE